MTSIITGDIINSRKLKNQSKWLKEVKKLFNELGKSPKTWEIYRGNSFQIEVSNPEDALKVAIHIKALVKRVKGIDVRMGIGIGKKEYVASRITESNGEAFINSGEKFQQLAKENQTLAIQTPWPNFDKEMNLYLRLALIAMDNWTPGAAEVIKILLESPKKTQKEIASDLKLKYQSYVSERKKRAHFDEIKELESLYRERIKKLIKT